MEPISVRFGRLPVIFFAFIAILALLLAACGGQQESAEEVDLTITATDTGYEVPAEVAAGYTSIRLDNTGTAPQHAQLLRLNDGVTMEQLQEALSSDNPDAALALVTLEGGAGTVSGGARSQVSTSNLTAGQYLVASFVPDANGVPGLARGFLAPFTVAGEGGGEMPTGNANVTLADFSITLPEAVEAQQVWAITNNGPQPHEMNILKLADGATMADVAAFFAAPAGPPPYTDAGGLQGIMSGATALLETNFEPGNYVALCFIPDPETGEPHVNLGMATEFTIP
jgi:hypothetical protein